MLEQSYMLDAEKKQEDFDVIFFVLCNFSVFIFIILNKIELIKN